MRGQNARNILISIFVILWIVIFHYESTRAFYLEPIFHAALPKIKFLFPPAGWIMFYNVGEGSGYVEIYGHTHDGVWQRIDPHEILRTRHFGYDNVHRNVLSLVLDEGLAQPFCAFLERKFPQFNNFSIREVYYPSLTQTPAVRLENTVYQCRADMSRTADGLSQGP